MERPLNDGHHANINTYNDFYIVENAADTA